ncbi:hypothetical protein Plhal304r1_c023g0079201 [Plasmopara halstedii]
MGDSKAKNLSHADEEGRDFSMQSSSAVPADVSAVMPQTTCFVYPLQSRL